MNLPQDNEQLRAGVINSLSHAQMERPSAFGEKVIEAEADNILALFQAEQTRLKAELIAQVRENLPNANPREWAGNQPQMAWTLGFEKALTEVTAVLDKLEGEV